MGIFSLANHVQLDSTLLALVLVLVLHAVWGIYPLQERQVAMIALLELPVMAKVARVLHAKQATIALLETHAQLVVQDSLVIVVPQVAMIALLAHLVMVAVARVLRVSQVTIAHQVGDNVHLVMQGSLV